MKITEEMLSALRTDLEKMLSLHRFSHTLGVERAAVKIGERCLPESITELQAAALLHDLTKEYSDEKQREILGQIENITPSDYLSPAVFHSLTAPYVIQTDYPEFALESILSAVRYHTTASPDMSVFDEIIFVSDFVEDTRVYMASTEERARLFAALDCAESVAESVKALRLSVLRILDFTVSYLKSKNKYINERTVLARDVLSQKYKSLLTDCEKNQNGN